MRLNFYGKNASCFSHSRNCKFTEMFYIKHLTQKTISEVTQRNVCHINLGKFKSVKKRATQKKIANGNRDVIK